ncbi:MAG: hypothetical protein WAK17_10355 [Candidatus Nitrosopolaris sp.]
MIKITNVYLDTVIWHLNHSGLCHCKKEGINLADLTSTTDLRPEMKRCGDISSDSSDAPIMISFPLIARPHNTAVIAFPLEAVPKITLAPPSLTSSSTLFCDLLSIYCVAPSFLTGSSCEKYLLLFSFHHVMY